MRWAITLAVVAVFVAACAGSTTTGESFEPVPPPSSTATTTETMVGAEPTEPTTVTETPPTTSQPIIVDGPPAPDFALALDDGRGFILSDESKPVYLIFWAEW